MAIKKIVQESRTIKLNKLYKNEIVVYSYNHFKKPTLSYGNDAIENKNLFNWH